MTVFDTRALTRPLLIDAEFTATMWGAPRRRRRSQGSGQTSLF